jgi:hypothetical protein
MRRFTVCQWIVIVGLAIDLSGIVLQLWVLHQFQDLIQTFGFGHVPRDRMPDGAGIDRLTRVLGIVGVALAFIAFFLAMARARRISQQCGITGYQYGFGWTWGSMFIPVMGLYRPWVGLAEIRKAIFISVRQRRLGNEWTNSAETSYATLALGLCVFIGGGLELIVSRALHQSPPHDAGGFSGWLSGNYSLMVAIMVLRTVKIAPLFIYILTLRGPLIKLIDLSHSDQTNLGIDRQPIAAASSDHP